MDELAERFISPGKALSQQSSAEARLERALLRSTKTMLQTIKRAALARSLQPAFATNLWHQAIVDTLTAVGIERGSQEWRFLADGLSQLDLGDEAYTSAMVVLNTARQINGTFMTQIDEKDLADALDKALDLETPSLVAAGGKPGDFYGELRQLGTTWRTRVNRTVRTGYTGFSGFVAQQAFRLARRQEKRWVAHHDDHTRHTHLEADGQTVAIEANFVIGGEQLQYPGDRRGTLSEIGNCRCVMVSPR
jgi:hypothetical protein